ncbi:MAG: DNRLRE domain-containing protein [Phycisphaerae bacterium]|nr:DNRLRE domain-containing protein [Phycisphaerae bacterium]
MKKLLFVLALICLLSSFIQAAIINISSCDDAWVERYWRWPSLKDSYYSNGSGSEIRVESYSASTVNYQYISYVKFDLSSLSDSAQITSASLNLYANAVGSQSSPSIYHAQDNWDEETIAYTTGPASGSTITDPGSWSNITNQWVSFNLYKWSYQADLTDDYLTVMVYGSSISCFSTKEYLDGSYAPYLSITYIPEPATICLLAIGSLAFIKRKK